MRRVPEHNTVKLLPQPIVLFLCISRLLCLLLQSIDLHLPLATFFKQKTAYEIRIRDWSSDVCSSD
eukprot:COSAG02_NODE_15513_length_1164_cov_1.096714_1_plen_65_part_10